MLIALDYDGTYTLDPDFWQRFIVNAQGSGHEVICATMRHPSEGKDICGTLKTMVKIIYTSRQAKTIGLSAQHIFPDIWIDDKPEWLFENAI